MTSPLVMLPPERVRVTLRVVWESLEQVRAVGACLRMLRRFGAARLLVTVSAMAFVVVFGDLVVNRHAYFATFDHDLGIWDQGTWLLSQGKQFNTVRGLDVFAFHASPALYLLVPFYWLGAGPHFLNLFMVVVYALAVIPVFGSANHYFRNEWHAAVPALCWLAHFSGQWMMQETFHPEVVALTPFLFAYWASLRESWIEYALWIGMALIWKEDVALSVIMLGLVLLLRRHPRAGLLTMAGAAAWFLVWTQLVIPHFSPEGFFTETLFGDLGGSSTEIVSTTLGNPDLALQHLENADSANYLRELSAPYGFVSWLSPLALLIGLPQLLINNLAIHNFFWSSRFHYIALPMLGFAIGAIEGPARFRSLGIRRVLLGMMAAGAIYTTISWGVGPGAEYYNRGYWPSIAGSQQDAYNVVVDAIGDEAAASASFNLVPHLSHRDQIYTFPNPWHVSNFGVNDTHGDDPDGVDWLAVDTTALSAPDRSLLATILDGSHIKEDCVSTSDPWDVLYFEENVLLARREGSSAQPRIDLGPPPAPTEVGVLFPDVVRATVSNACAS